MARSLSLKGFLFFFTIFRLYTDIRFRFEKSYLDANIQVQQPVSLPLDVVLHLFSLSTDDLVGFGQLEHLCFCSKTSLATNEESKSQGVHYQWDLGVHAL